MNRPAEAMAQIEMALAVDPFNPLIHMFHAGDLLARERYDEAIAAAGRAPGNPVAASVTWYARSMLGEDAETAVALKAFLATLGDPNVQEAFERGFAEGGYRDGVKGAAEALVASPVAQFVPMDLAALYLEARETTRALDWMERGVNDRDPNVPYLGLPIWDRLSGNPRFQALWRRIGLPEQVRRPPSPIPG